MKYFDLMYLMYIILYRCIVHIHIVLYKKYFLGMKLRDYLLSII